MLPAPDRSRHVVVDMTALGPRGQNGGAGLVATSLVHHMAALAPWTQFTLLTAQASHAELARLDAPNVRRECFVETQSAGSMARGVAQVLLPARARVRLKDAIYSLRTSGRYSQTTVKLQPDLLFCPFTVSRFWQHGVRCVCIVYDLQHVSYPEFFSPEQRLNRERHLQQASARADRLVCISEYVRRTLLGRAAVDADRVQTIPLGLLQEPAAPDPTILTSLGLKKGEFLVYPANFWPHKNHEKLFEALRLFHNRHPHSRLRLVCTGAPNALMDRLAAEPLSEGVVFAGYVSPGSLAALLDASAALIFPSLYEGFGMPVLEAMARGTPVLCSNVTSLPEVAGDAAITFDPRDVTAIAGAIDALVDRVRIEKLVQRGRERAAGFGTARDMATRYLGVFEDVLAVRA